MLCMYLFELLLSFSLHTYQAVELLGHTVVLWFFWGGNSIVFSIVAAPIYSPTNSVLDFPFVYILTNICHLWSFFLWWLMNDVEQFFHALVGHLYVFFGKFSIQVFYPFLLINQVICFFRYGVVWAACIFGY